MWYVETGLVKITIFFILSCFFRRILNQRREAFTSGSKNREIVIFPTDIKPCYLDLVGCVEDKEF